METNVVNDAYLQQVINTLEQDIKNNRLSSNAVLSLTKTLQSHNITIENWNAIVKFVSANKLYLDKMYNTFPDVIEYLYNELKAYTKEYVDGNLGNLYITAEDVLINIDEN